MGEGKNSSRKPEIARVTPAAAIPGGEVQIRGKQLAGSEQTVVALVSGTGLKDQRWLPSEGGRAVEIEPSVEAVERALWGT